MDYSYGVDNLRSKIIAQNITFDSAEEYFFILGQFLMYVFYCIGGIHRHSKEFNYLTNPYIPQSVQQLGIRTVRFISKLSAKLFRDNKAASDTIHCLLKSGDLYLYSSVNVFNCTEAFFEGIHNKNLFIEIYN